MKQLFFIRHAKSSWDDFTLADIDRPLNKRGLRDAPIMAERLRTSGIAVDGIATSPAKRAYTTATYFADAFELSPPQLLVKDEIYQAMPGAIFDVVRTLPKDWSTALIFGHNPTFTTIANFFSTEIIPNVPTCGILHIESKIDNWTTFDRTTGQLIAFHYPKDGQ